MVVHPGIVAMDNQYYPFGTRVTIQNGPIKTGVNEDTGSMIVGNHIDVWMSDCHKAMLWGRRIRLVRLELPTPYHKSIPTPYASNKKSEGRWILPR